MLASGTSAATGLLLSATTWMRRRSRTEGHRRRSRGRCFVPSHSHSPGCQDGPALSARSPTHTTAPRQAATLAAFPGGWPEKIVRKGKKCVPTVATLGARSYNTKFVQPDHTAHDQGLAGNRDSLRGLSRPGDRRRRKDEMVDNPGMAPAGWLATSTTRRRAPAFHRGFLVSACPGRAQRGGRKSVLFRRQVRGRRRSLTRRRGLPALFPACRWWRRCRQAGRE
jgi:hypothetical protein